MLHRFPPYYPAFGCTGSACRDNCCIGWEIDIDPETAARYDALPGPLGQRLRENISRDEPRHFLLDSRERCPFLDGQNLCRIYSALGEAALCEICREHPRFHNWYGPFAESGLGLCCEEACRLILTNRQPFTLLEQEDAQPPEGAENPLLLSQLLQVRKAAFSLAQNPAYTLPQCLLLILLLANDCQQQMDEGEAEQMERTARDWLRPGLCQQVLDELPIPPDEAAAPVLLSLFSQMEKNSPDWAGWVAQLARTEGLPGQAGAFALENPDALPELKQVLLYLLYRYLLQSAQDGELLVRVQAILCCVLFLLLGQVQLWRQNAVLPPDRRHALCKEFSKEVEYSDLNLGLLLQHCHRNPALSVKSLAALLQELHKSWPCCVQSFPAVQ